MIIVDGIADEEYSRQPYLMATELASATADLAKEIAGISYRAFLAISSAHGFPPDFPSLESAYPAYELLIDRPDYIGLVAMVDGRPVGSNFLMMSDSVAAIGPLTVEPGRQGQGIGRLLMQSLMGRAAAHGYRELRLLQDTYNVTSLALYCSLGFDVRDTVALVSTTSAEPSDSSVRLLVPSDIPAIDRLCLVHYNTTRKNELAILCRYGFPIYVRELRGAITGYYMPGLFGHGISQTSDDAFALISQVTKIVPTGFQKFLCPTKQSELLLRSLKAGWKIEKLLTYMTYGPYKETTGVCTPSACY
jgi:GNAT superfamily N-acetyltransferase